MTTSDAVCSTLRIEGMTCGHCVASVDEALSALPGVRAVRIDLDAGSAEVDHDEAFDEAAAAVAIEDAGYRVLV